MTQDLVAETLHHPRRDDRWVFTKHIKEVHQTAGRTCEVRPPFTQEVPEANQQEQIRKCEHAIRISPVQVALRL